MSSYHPPTQAYQAHAAPPPRSVQSFNPVAVVNAPAGTFLPGTKVQVGSHRVVVEKYLSEGGFAHVYVVRLSQPIEGSDRAVLKRVAVPDKSALANMRTEVETMKKLKGHRHIVKYIDSHASQLRGGGYEVFLLMEFCSGGGLIDFMNTRLQNRLTEPEIIKIFSDVAEGVACMHYLKPPLLHRDLKVENVLISLQGKTPLYKLCDFGSTAPPRPAATTAAEGRLIEDDVQRHTTLQYRSPEMIDVYRKQPIDEKSDIWALGVLLYKLCYYTTPFEEVGQMAILNASYKFHSYPLFSDRLKALIASMLKENPQQRPTIYEVVREVCTMQGKEVPIRDIYASRSVSEARRYQELPPSPVEAPQLGAVFSPPMQETQIIPEIAPMRRGRPTKPDHSPHTSAKANASPFRESSASDPFAILDGNGHRSRNSIEDFSNRFPALDQFSILNEQKDKFDFEPAAAEKKPEDDDLARRLTNALADDAFAKRPDPPQAEAPRELPIIQRPQTSAVDTKPVEPSRHVREQSAQQTPLYQPVPQRPVMVSTGTMTSPPATPAFVEPKPSSRPIHRFPSSDHQRQSSTHRWSESDQKPPRLSQAASPTRPEPSRISSDKLSSLSSTSSRPSLEGRPSNLDVDDPVGRSKSANGKTRPVSVHAGSRLEFSRGSGSARSSLDLSRPMYEGGAPLQHARTEMDQIPDRANISSDVDFLRAREEELNRKREKRYSGSTKHSKRSSLSTLSLSGTKTLFGGRFGDAFRRFEQSNQDKAPSPPAAEDAAKPFPSVTASELAVESAAEVSDEENEEDISPEMRRELERRRLSQEEKRVAAAAAEYRRRVAARGEGGPGAGSDGHRSSAIQSRVQSLLGQSNKPPPQKTATGYGRYTDESDSALQAKQTTDARPESRPGTRGAGAPYPSSQERAPSVSPQEGAPTGWSSASGHRTGSRPMAPPKPKGLRVGGGDLSRPTGEDRSPTSTTAPTPISPGDDWEANFSRRFPSLSGLEMVETEIEIPKFASSRTKEV
ncbi:putative serine/threonine protein kinase [Aspergillus clavatus NRRL 1]|uniref:non-specific serine/threonine protein kinase n=1 Tax=Aspergillus clavatus (strain ATCC 1007 / CBS 513.65 / DSM 816 / NCTC 3887 / NRRL 1 / QM 1276 / 107) TaxID=344612 RepID=A1CR71_ASPCL|nr:serine/threonine protein kinase, putative [Aspergillus clavatus NRRL 1]EAW08142.1 serine/threonine protein kinase, putative [Aspergillus clavatus NRRL 1]